MTNRWDITRAVRLSDLPAPSRLVMLVLADVAEVGTGEIPERFTPSLNVLARETGLDKSTVVRHLDLLDAAGWVVRTKPTAEAARMHAERTRYRLTIPAGRTEQPDLGAERVTLGAEDDRGSRTERQDLVAENDKPSRTVRQRRTDLLPTDHSSSDLRPDVEKVCEHLADWIVKNGSKRPVIGKRWRTAARLMIDADHRPVDKILKAIDWCQQDEFWRGNILSMDKLRQRYEQLRLAAQRPRGRPTAPVTPSAAEKIPAAEQCPDHPGRRRQGCGLCRAANLGAKPPDHEGSAA